PLAMPGPSGCCRPAKFFDGRPIMAFVQSFALAAFLKRRRGCSPMRISFGSAPAPACTAAPASPPGTAGGESSNWLGPAFSSPLAAVFSSVFCSTFSAVLSGEAVDGTCSGAGGSAACCVVGAAGIGASSITTGPGASARTVALRQVTTATTMAPCTSTTTTALIAQRRRLAGLVVANAIMTQMLSPTHQRHLEVARRAQEIHDLHQFTIWHGLIRAQVDGPIRVAFGGCVERAGQAL